MPRRSILTARQQVALFGLPEDEQTILHYYTFSDEDIGHIQEKRKPQNRIGFALQLCAFRYPGRFLQPREVIPTRMLSFIGAQLGIDEDALATYGQRQQTKHEHSKQLQAIYGFTPLAGEIRAQMQQWLVEAAENARSNEELARLFLQECRNRQVIVPGETVVERLCGAALVDAEQHITMRICYKLDSEMRERLLSLLGETIDGRLTLFVWLRQFEPGNNSSAANQLLDRLEYLQRLNIPESVVANIPNHRIGRLRRQGERYYADGLRDVHKERRLAILAVCAIEWKAMIADTLIETHVRSLIAANIKEELIERQWPDVVRLIASIVTQRVVPSQMLRTLSSFSRQNELAFALREIGRIERTIFILQWIRNTDLQRRAQIGLNKGEAHHALKRALNFNRNGEIRDRATENQHYRMLGLNLLTAIVIYWNTKHLGKLMKEMEEQGKDVLPELKSHVSPLGWEHIILAEYLWKNP